MFSTGASALLGVLQVKRPALDLLGFKIQKSVFNQARRLIKHGPSETLVPVGEKHDTFMYEGDFVRSVVVDRFFIYMYSVYS